MLVEECPVEQEQIAWMPQDGPQTFFCTRWEFEILYGGAAGGGKTDCLIAESLRDIGHPNYNGLLLRRTFPQLQEIIDRTRVLYPLYGGIYRTGEHRWYFPSGAKVNLGHCQHEGDEYNFQGKEYQYIGFDEAGQFTRRQYLYLFSRCRSKYPELQCRIRSASNPGGVGHQFLKDRFAIGFTAPNTTIYDEATGLSRMFIPAKLKDNPILMLNDPMYIQRLMLLPEIERLRLMEGIWDAFEGQAIPELNQSVHGVDPFDIPPEWPRYRCFDWGYSTPFAVLWFAVDVDGIPYLYREWYGSKLGETPNMGLRMSPTEIARGINDIEKPELQKGIKVHPGPADPDIWNPRWTKMGKKNFGVVGKSVADDMSAEGVHFLRADNERILGRQQVHHRLSLDDKGDPQILIFNNCTHFWRTMPLLRESSYNPEDIEDKNVEDHIYSVLRYFCMFKPLQARVKKKDDVGSFQYERRKYIKAKQLASRTGMSMSQAYGRMR